MVVSNISYFHPYLGKIFFSDGLKPPTSFNFKVKKGKKQQTTRLKHGTEKKIQKESPFQCSILRIHATFPGGGYPYSSIPMIPYIAGLGVLGA